MVSLPSDPLTPTHSRAIEVSPEVVALLSNGPDCTTNSSESGIAANGLYKLKISVLYIDSQRRYSLPETAGNVVDDGG